MNASKIKIALAGVWFLITLWGSFWIGCNLNIGVLSWYTLPYIYTVLAVMVGGIALILS